MRLSQEQIEQETTRMRKVWMRNRAWDLVDSGQVKSFSIGMLIASDEYDRLGMSSVLEEEGRLNDADNKRERLD